MSYFNSDQQDHMKHLASLPRDQRCVCGWNAKGDCYHPECIEQTKQVNAERHATPAGAAGRDEGG